MKNDYDGILKLHNLAYRIEDSNLPKTNTRTQMPECKPPKDPEPPSVMVIKQGDDPGETLKILLILMVFAAGTMFGALVCAYENGLLN